MPATIHIDYHGQDDDIRDVSITARKVIPGETVEQLVDRLLGYVLSGTKRYRHYDHIEIRVEVD
jgi:hypothetical protein